MYLQTQENKNKQSSVMNLVSQESNSCPESSDIYFPPTILTLPPPNSYYPPYHYFNKSTSAVSPSPSFFVPPYPPPNFSANEQSSISLLENTNQHQGLSLCSFGYLQEAKTYDERTTDSVMNSVLDHDLWLPNWLSRVKGRKVENSPFSYMKVSEMKECFKKCIFQVKKLENLKQKMELSHENMSIKDWSSLSSNFVEGKKNVADCITKLPDSKALKIVAERSKKRSRQRRKNEERKAKNIQDNERRQQLHHQIDTWMKDMQETIDCKKREESLKKEADFVLCEVLRKKAEGRRQLALVSALVKLRLLRAKSAGNRGQLIPIDTGIKFSKVAENLKNLWEKQLREYDVEENGMRVMLSEAVDERDQSQVLRDRQIFAEWHKLLFGSNASNIPEFYLQANKSIESFVCVRQAWDKFVVHSETSVQSNIPLGWVIPSNPSDAWEKLLT